MIDIDRVVKIACKTCDGTGRAKAYSSRGEPYLSKCWNINCFDGYRFETDEERPQRQRDEWKARAEKAEGLLMIVRDKIEHGCKLSTVARGFLRALMDEPRLGSYVRAIDDLLHKTIKLATPDR